LFPAEKNERFSYLEQIFLNFRSNIISEDLMFTIKKLATAQIIVEKEIFSKDKSQKEAKIKLIVNKKNGYSIQEVFSIIYL